MKLTDILKCAAEYIGYITAIIVFLTVTIKPLRTKVGNKIRKISKTDEQGKRVCDLSDKIDSLIDVMTEYVAKNDEVHDILLDSIKILQAGSAALLGNQIKEIYNQYKDEKRIPEKEFEIVEKMYAIYHGALNGNGVIERIYEEMKTWEIIM